MDNNSNSLIKASARNAVTAFQKLTGYTGRWSLSGKKIFSSRQWREQVRQLNRAEALLLYYQQQLINNGKPNESRKWEALRRYLQVISAEFHALSQTLQQLSGEVRESLREDPRFLSLQEEIRDHVKVIRAIIELQLPEEASLEMMKNELSLIDGALLEYQLRIIKGAN